MQTATVPIAVTATTTTIIRIPVLIMTMREPQNSLPLVGDYTSAALLKLLTFISPAFPVGAFSYSHGLEWQIDCGAIRSADSLQAWIDDLLEVGSGWNDAVLLAEAHRTAANADALALREVVKLAAALPPSRERHLESTTQGRSFLDAAAATWSCGVVNDLLQESDVAYPVAVGAVAADHHISLDIVLPAYLNAFAASLVSVGVRLIPIGQTAGLRILASLHPVIAVTARSAASSTIDDLGSSTILSDVASMRHEGQYSRVFRT